MSLFLVGGLLVAPGVALANNPAATVAGLAIDAVIVGLQAAIAVDSPVSGGKTGEAGSETAKQTADRVVTPIFVSVIRSVGLNLLDFIVNRLAYDAAVALASGGKGQTGLIEFQSPETYFRNLGLDIVGEAIGSLEKSLSEATNQAWGICVPQDPIKKLGLQIGLKQAYTRNAPSCEFNNFLAGINAVGARYAGDVGGDQNILRRFAEAYKPGQSELSASIEFNLAVHQQVNLAKTIGLQEALANKGFKNVVDVITGEVKTPAVLILEQSNAAIKNSKLGLSKEAQLDTLTKFLGGDAEVLKQIGLQGLSVFVNTLLSSLGNNLFSGLFNPSGLNVDPFNPEASIVGGRERAEETYRSILSAPILSFDDYNIMNEFVICPGDDLRGLNNCVMDQGFASAVGRARAGTALTVQDAIDGGFLHGDWPLIPSSDEGRNQDIRCSTYGYCYSNLVKIRRARVIPIGWELVANSSFNNESSPVTLQQAIDGFFSCNDQGQADDSHKWCHLIDPNWVLKIPPAQCRAFVPSELPISSLVNARQSVCVDSPTCIAQDDSGACVGGYGYCTQETNTWQFNGDTCPAEYAGCLAFNNVRTGSSGDYLLNTIDTDGCDADNPGCRWYRTNKYEDDKGTSETTDDTFEFLPTGEIYDVALHDASVGLGALVNPTSFGYDTDGDDVDDFSYTNYAFEDRFYVNQNVGTCSAESAGCTELISADTARLNLLRNPSFEDDEDEDGVPDGWFELLPDTFPDGYDTLTGSGFEGIDAVTNVDGSLSFQQEGIALSANRFYTLSFYVNTTVASSSPVRIAMIELIPQTGTSAVNLLGTTILGGCSVSQASHPNRIFLPVSTTAGDGYVRKTCTFTTPSIPTYATVSLTDATGSSDETYYDAFQLELGSVPGTFQEGYGEGTITREYLTVPPTWLGCTGSASDPALCGDYTRVCTAQDVGCDLYTPTLGGFGVPAVTSSADTCPSACVGYETYKQESTPYEAENFPQYFIANSARVCSQADVGCDAYTNLNAVALGGEGIEYYSGLRFCSAPDQTTAEATFYTWEGTASEGFQLRSWSLLESNLNDTLEISYAEPLETSFSFIESNIGRAPCTHSVVISEDAVVCQDDVRGDEDNEEYGFTDCNEHADIFDNPDCREFYDTSGNIHYRLLSQTAVISNECAPYRKDGGLQADCTDSGGFWTAGGSCRYFVLASESGSCSETSAGCRAYTGASGRNASTIFTDTVEDGSLNEYTSASSAVISNESISAGGHSVHVTGTSFNMLSLVEGTATITAGDMNDNGSCDEGELCTFEDAGGSSCEATGTDTSDDTDDCGPWVNRLVQGKTYILEFWAKGNGPVQTFTTVPGQGTVQIEPRFVEARGAGDSHAFSTLTSGVVTITSQWQLYTVGPLDTSDAVAFADFDDTAILQFFVSAGTVDYDIDNINLRETEENLALIKDSWVTPSSCDLSPTGTPSPQHYLGCQEYQDGSGAFQNLHQFTRLCQEEMIGCSAYFDTQNSEATFTQTFNATCALPTPENVTVSTSTACTMSGETVCTIVSGRNSCHFDFDGALPNPLPSSPRKISLGPEARMVPNDTDLFLVNRGETSCGAATAGCYEVGLPTFNQNKTAVTGFDTTYLIDDPDQYNATLCDTEGLFCEAWSTTADGTFYFKDPSNQTCDYRPSVTINNQQYYGWFRTGSQPPAPCYYDDLDDDGAFDTAELSSAYLVSGISFGIWRNGDQANYDGWLASCPSRYDRCSDFVDPMDTSDGLYPNGTPYVYIKNDKID
ncbi:MAG: hypothetical protein UY81_C0009G0001, partial [Candidatus Giovannonibacteria bacterium GW2011_GWA2_53_7]